MKARFRKTFTVFAALVLATLAPKLAWAAASLQNYTGATCGAVSSTVTIEFQIQASANQQAFYSVAFSTDTTPAAGDSWVAGNCSTGSGVGAGPEGGTPTWKTITLNVNVPGGFAGGYVLILAKQNFMNCTPDQQLSIPFSIVCNTPTPTATRTATALPSPTRTATPSMPFNKSSNVSVVSVGDTITFCINWTNDSGGAVSKTYTDVLVPQFSYLGGQAGCSAAGQTVTCSFSEPANSSGSKCFWATVVSP